jgi:hypothetical protein
MPTEGSRVMIADHFLRVWVKRKLVDWTADLTRYWLPRLPRD